MKIPLYDNIRLYLILWSWNELTRSVVQFLYLSLQRFITKNVRKFKIYEVGNKERESIQIYGETPRTKEQVLISNLE